MKRKLIIKINFVWLVAVLTLTFYSVLVAVSAYVFNLALYLILVGYSVTSYTLGLTRHYKGEEYSRVKLLPLLLVLLMVALLVALVILLMQTPSYPHAMGG